MNNVKAKLALHDRIARVMADERFHDGRSHGHDLRSFIVAHYWARFESKDSDTAWTRTKDLAGVTSSRLGHKMTGHRIRELFRADAPRFEPPFAWRVSCCALMLRGPRTGEPCGRSASLSFKVTDAATGEWDTQGWCSRHRLDGERAARCERTKVVTVEPTPNIGGLLPCYIRASNWPELYESSRPGWKPPKIGIVADDWPVLARVVAHERPVLSVLDGDDEESDVALPALRLVSS